MRIPDHLVKPSCEGYKYGKLTYSGRHKMYYIEGEPAMLELAKRVFPGTRMDFSGRNRKVRFKDTSRSVENLNWFMLRFPLEVECWDVLDKDRERAIAQAQRREANNKLELVDTPKTFLADLFDFQKEGVDFLIKNERALLADEMGLGKTFTALGAVSIIQQYPVLVVPQAHLRLQWQRVIGSLFEVPDIDNPKVKASHLTHIVKGLKPYKLPEKPFYICHYGLLRGWRDVLLELGIKTLIFDEVQELRHTGTQKYSVATELSQETSCVYGLSGTPIYGYGAEVWSVMNALDYHCLSDFESFTREWCSGYGTKTVIKPDILGDYLRREGLMIRHRKKDVYSQLPKVRRVVQIVDKDDDVYNKLVVEAVKVANRYHNIKEWHERGKAASFIERESRQATGIAKAPFVVEFVKTLVEGGEKVLLAAWHHAVHDIYIEKLKKYGLVKLTGRESQDEKQRSLDQFIEGDADIALLSLRTAAGLDGLQERGTCIVFGELDWSPAVHSQIESRLERIGIDLNVDSILSYYCVSDSGYDEVIQEALGLKTAQFTLLMADDPETEEDKVLARQKAKASLEMIINKMRTNTLVVEPPPWGAWETLKSL